jgi:hypothetical protein
MKILVLLVLSSIRLFSCSYIVSPTEKSFNFADFVFIGKVTATQVIPKTESVPTRMISTIVPSKVFKGNVPKTLKVFSSDNTGPCGDWDVFLEHGDEVIVFAYFEQAGKYWLRKDEDKVGEFGFLGADEKILRSKGYLGSGEIKQYRKGPSGQDRIKELRALTSKRNWFFRLFSSRHNHVTALRIHFRSLTQQDFLC